MVSSRLSEQKKFLVAEGNFFHRLNVFTTILQLRGDRPLLLLFIERVD